jgi:hypothetical protein
MSLPATSRRTKDADDEGSVPLRCVEGHFNVETISFSKQAAQYFGEVPRFSAFHRRHLTGLLPACIGFRSAARIQAVLARPAWLRPRGPAKNQFAPKPVKY